MRRFPTACFLIFLAIACSNDPKTAADDQTEAKAEVPLPFPKFKPVFQTDFEVDSFQGYALTQKNGVWQSGFRFSPFEKNKIWFTPQDVPPFEMDLKTGFQQPLAEKFGHAFFQKRLRQSDIFPDKFDPETCWFVNGYEGVFHFDKRLGQGHFFKPQHMAFHGVVFSEKTVWIGSSEGTFSFDRATGVFQPLPQKPANGTGFVGLGENQTLISMNHVFDPQTNCWSDLSEFYGVPVSSFQQFLQIGGYSVFTKHDDNAVFFVQPDGKTTKTIEAAVRQLPGGGIQTTPMEKLFDFLSDLKQPPLFWTFMEGQIARFDARDGSFRKIMARLPKTPYEVCKTSSPEDVWIFEHEFWFSVDAKTEKTFVAKPLFHEKIVDAQADSRHLYLMTNDSFFIVSKRFLKNRGGDEAHFARLQWLNFLADSMRWKRNGDDWRDFNSRLAVFRQEFEGETDPNLLSILKNFEEDARQIWPSEAEARAMIAAEKLDSTLTDAAHFKLMRLLARRGNLREAVSIGQKWRKKRPETPFFNEKKDGSRDWLVLKNTHEKLDSLDKSHLPDDRKLFEKARVVCRLCCSCGFFEGEACYDTSLGDSIYQRLLRKFPGSELADDAEFAVNVNGLCYEGEDGSGHPEEVEMWQRFLKKYPDSELRPKVVLNMVRAFGRDADDLREGLRMLKILEDEQPELFKKTAEYGQFWGLKQSFQNKLDFFELQFSMKLKKEKTRRGEPVEVVFELKNTGKKAKKIQIIAATGFPNFEVEVSPENAGGDCVLTVGFEAGEKSAWPKSEADYKMVEVLPGKSFRETWDLTKNIRKNRASNLGRFVFDRAGVYTISGFWHGLGEEKTSRLLRLQVE